MATAAGRERDMAAIRWGKVTRLRLDTEPAPDTDITVTGYRNSRPKASPKERQELRGS
jgi:hypothetical protein